MLVLERREVHMATALVVRYFTDGTFSVTGEKDGKEDPGLVQTMNVQNPDILNILETVKTSRAPDVLREEVRRRHTHQSEINDIREEFQSWTFIVGSNTCVVKLIGGVWKEICEP